jgi:hypothetical protein
MWIGVDLDGTLAEHKWDGTLNPNFDPLHIGPPIPKMLARVKKWVAQGVEVRILTARANPNGRGYARHQEVVRGIRAWCKLHVGVELEVTNAKDYDMLELWDDRAIQVIENTGDRADGVIDDA